MISFIITNTNKTPAEVNLIVNDEFKRAMQATVDAGEKLVAAKTPVGATGNARRSIEGRVIKPDHGEIAGEGTGKNYIDFVEAGRRGGKAPPRAPIELWLRRTAKGRRFVAAVKARYKIKSDVTALNQAVYLKQRGIARRGTPGAFMFKNATPQIARKALETFTAAIAAIERKAGDK